MSVFCTLRLLYRGYVAMIHHLLMCMNLSICQTNGGYWKQWKMLLIIWIIRKEFRGWCFYKWLSWYELWAHSLFATWLIVTVFIWTVRKFLICYVVNDDYLYVNCERIPYLPHGSKTKYVVNLVMLARVSESQGPVVQSIVSLTSSLRVISLTILADSIHNILIFFAEKMWVAFALQKLLTFFQQKISAYLRITQCKF